jgi:hypothetical protein
LQHAEHEPNVAPEVVVKPRGSQDLPEVAHGPEGLAQNGIYSPELGTYSKEKELAPVPTDISKKKLCGMRRGIAIGLIVAILVVIATVGGAVGGIIASKNKTVNFLARIQRDKHLFPESTMPRPASLHLQGLPAIRLVRTTQALL